MSISDKLNTIAENEQKVYEAGKTKEWSDFWENYQKTAWGTRTDYIMAFCGIGWNDITFIPKYDIKPTTAERMFSFFGSQKGKTFDLVSLLNKAGVQLDFSKCTNFYYTFYGAMIDKVGTIDFSKCTTAANAFANSMIKTVEKLIFAESSSVTGMFNNAAITNINSVEGTIGKTISFASCSLTRLSIENVVNALSDTVTDVTVTFKKTAKETAFDDEEWATLIATKPNWTFSLI